MIGMTGNATKTETLGLLFFKTAQQQAISGITFIFPKTNWYNNCCNPFKIDGITTDRIHKQENIKCSNK